ncbi:MAG: hypothetical protein HQL56_08860 [Magnetococcales bacterium]|nr:hypothetical protein [Magnetococcales bacterium]
MNKFPFHEFLLLVALLLLPNVLSADEVDCTDFSDEIVTSREHKCFDPDMSYLRENPWPIIKRCLALQKEGDDRFKPVIPCLMQGIDYLGPNLMNRRTLAELPQRLDDFVQAFDQLIRLVPVSCHATGCTMPGESDLDLERTRLRIFILEHLDPVISSTGGCSLQSTHLSQSGPEKPTKGMTVPVNIDRSATFHIFLPSIKKRKCSVL